MHGALGDGPGVKRARVIFFAHVVDYGVLVYVPDYGEDETLDSRAFTGGYARLQLGGLQVLDGDVSNPGFYVVLPCGQVIFIERAIFHGTACGH